TAGSQSVTATDIVTGSINGVDFVTVNAAAATHFKVINLTAPSAGVNFILKVTAQDQFNNTATTYAGTVHFTSSDGQAILPANAALTPTGIKSFNVTLKTSGVQTVVATDTLSASITGTDNLNVAPASAASFKITAPANATVGVSIGTTVTVLDAFGNTATGYNGTVQFTSSDPSAALPASTTLAPGIGAGNFSVTLYSAGTQSFTATDSSVSTITGSAMLTVAKANTL